MRNSVATKEISVVTEVEKNHKRMLHHSKECCNKVEELEEETYVTTKENYVATKDEEERTKDCRDRIQSNIKMTSCVATKFYVATQDTHVAA